MIKTDPKNVIYNAKRFIGKSFADASVARQSLTQSYTVLPSPTGLAAFSVPANATLQLSPPAVGSAIVNHLLDMAKKHLGHGQIKSAIIAVPAKFSSKQVRREC